MQYTRMETADAGSFHLTRCGTENMQCATFDALKKVFHDKWSNSNESGRQNKRFNLRMKNPCSVLE